ncbi:SDR family NAD(P)-dependent oxidoreductase [Botrimarina sp.]|uniref:SDR family NAD(P)-dependent oxidoreductase n=1 Tax=Botrimarina sp. TaxID=2795802 RepID=UPI0032EE66B8
MRPLTGKTALVTGAARGIGRAIALRLADKGVRLALADRDVAGLARVRSAVEARGARAVVLPCDLAHADAVERLADDLLRRWAGVDLLVNNAGVAYHGATDRCPLDRQERLVAVNLLAPMRLTSRLLPALLARPEAHVLFVASVLGLTPMPRVAAYCATKHALVGYAACLRGEYGRSGLGVTTLCPGFVRTPIIEEAADQPGRREPPAWACVTIDRVARAAVAGVERNRRCVVVDPVGRWVRGAMAAAPGMVDWLNLLGRGRRVAAKRRRLALLDTDPEAALRRVLQTQRAAPVESPMRRAA